MLRVLRAIVLYLVFMFLTVLVVAWAMPDAPVLLQLALFFGVPAWLVRRSTRRRAAPETAGAPAAPAADAAPPVPQRDPETLEEFEEARAREPALRWVGGARWEQSWTSQRARTTVTQRALWLPLRWRRRHLPSEPMRLVGGGCCGRWQW